MLRARAPPTPRPQGERRERQLMVATRRGRRGDAGARLRPDRASRPPRARASPHDAGRRRNDAGRAERHAGDHGGTDGHGQQRGRRVPTRRWRRRPHRTAAPGRRGAAQRARARHRRRGPDWHRPRVRPDPAHTGTVGRGRGGRDRRGAAARSARADSADGRRARAQHGRASRPAARRRRSLHRSGAPRADARRLQRGARRPRRARPRRRLAVGRAGASARPAHRRGGQRADRGGRHAAAAAAP